MAILNGGLLGTSRNKVGGIVSYRLRGQTVAREYVQTINNPRSAAQMVQRAKLINLVAAYRANRFWMASGAFESKKATWSDYNAFVSANTLLNPVYMTRPMVAAGAGIVQAYQVTRGSLPTIQTQWDVNDDFFRTDLYGPSESLSTIAALSAALIANNNGIREGDQLSFIANYQRVGNNGYPYILARAYELIIDTTDTRNVVDVIPGITTWQPSGDTASTLAWDNNFNSELAGVAIILSRDTSGQIAVSNQSLVLTPAMAQYVATWQSASAYAAYAASYGEGDTNFLAGGYSGATSNPDVPLGTQIVGISSGQQTLSPVGGSALAVRANTNYYIHANGALQGVTAIQIDFNNSTSSLPSPIDIQNPTIDGAGRVVIPASALTQYVGRYIMEVVVLSAAGNISGSWDIDEDGGDVE